MFAERSYNEIRIDERSTIRLVGTFSRLHVVRYLLKYHSIITFLHGDNEICFQEWYKSGKNEKPLRQQTFLVVIKSASYGRWQSDKTLCNIFYLLYIRNLTIIDFLTIIEIKLIKLIINYMIKINVQHVTSYNFFLMSLLHISISLSLFFARKNKYLY